MLKTAIINEIKTVLKPFDRTNLVLPTIALGIESTAQTAIVGLPQWHSGLDGDILFGLDPEPYLRIYWEEMIDGTHDEVIFRFKPLRVEINKSDLIAAYDRAMSII